MASNFDIDLREGKAREDAFVNVMFRSKVEHKRDRKCWKTGNHAVEFEQRHADGIVRPSGVSLESERWAVEYSTECWLIVPTEFVRKLARIAINRGAHCWGGDGNNAHIALVPITWFVQPPF